MLTGLTQVLGRLLRAFIPTQMLLQAFDKSDPWWERLIYATVFALFCFAAVVGAALKYHASSASALGLEKAFIVTVIILFFLAIACLITVVAAASIRRLGIVGSVVQGLKLFGKTLLFIFLPAAIVTAVVVGWAIATHQPGLR